MKALVLLFIISFTALAQDYEQYRIIPKGRAIFDEATKKAYKLEKNLVVKIERHDEDQEFFTIKSKDGTQTYLVHFTALEELAPVLRMYRPPHVYEELPFKERKKVKEKRFGIRQSLALVLGSHVGSFTNDRAEELALGNQISYQAFFDSEKPWQIGVEFGSYNGQSLGEEDNYQYSSLMIGPALRFTQWSEQWKAELALTQALNSKLTLEEKGEIKLNHTMVGLKLVSEHSQIFGTLKWGFNLNYSWFKFKESNLALTDEGQLDHHFGGGIVFGFGFY